MSRTGTCDQCSGSIQEGDGYLFYSTIGILGVVDEAGNMFLCEGCASAICSQEGFAREPPKRTEVPIADLTGEAFEMVVRTHRDLNAASIAQLCKRHGLSPEQAKTKARELAELWWREPDKAQVESARFWKSASAPVKKWWQFWK